MWCGAQRRYFVPGTRTLRGMPRGWAPRTQDPGSRATSKHIHHHNAPTGLQTLSPFLLWPPAPSARHPMARESLDFHRARVARGTRVPGLRLGRLITPTHAHHSTDHHLSAACHHLKDCEVGDRVDLAEDAVRGTSSLKL